MLKNNYILLINKFDKKKKKQKPPNKQTNNQKIQPYISFISYGSVHKVECYTEVLFHVLLY